MKAIYKRELKSNGLSISGAVAIAVMLFIMGYMFFVYNSYYAVATYGSYSVLATLLVFYIVVPMLTMKCFSEEKKQKTDQLLLTAPVKVSEIVWGKYLAIVTIFAVPCLIMCVYPLLVNAMGSTTWAIDYVSIMTFFLMGCAYLAIGMFLSTLSENQIITVILNLAFVALTQMGGNASSFLSSGSFGNLIFLVILFALLMLIVYIMTKNWYLALIIFAALVILSCVLYKINSSWFSDIATTILGALDFRGQIGNVCGGSYSIGSTVYFLSFAAVGVFLTNVIVEKRRWS